MDSRKLERLKALLKENAESLVDSPEHISVSVRQTEESITFTLKAKNEEVGQLVGRNGRIGNALRTLIKSATRKEEKTPVYLNIEG